MTTPTKPETVWVAVFILRDSPYQDGPDVTIHRTKEGAEAMLVERVRECWESEMSDETEMPEDAEEMVNTFFDEVSGIHGVSEQAILP